MGKHLKTLYAVSILLILLTLAAPLAALPFLPDSIPAHYNAAGTVDRWGSKYETLIFPAFLVPYGAIWTACGRLWRKQPEKTAELLWMIGNIAQFAVFDLMLAYFLYADFRQVQRLPDLPLDLNRLLCAVTGLGLIALGNWIPKLKKPGPMGLRTPWSVKNEAVWRKCQRFGGWPFAAAGAVSAAAALLAPGAWCWLWTTLALASAGIAGAVYSRHAAQTTPDE